MEATILTVHWHDGEQPVYSVAFQYDKDGRSERLATGGGDNNVRIWKLMDTEEGETKVEYLSTLSKHTQAVNAVSFDPTGQLLATAGDDGSVMIWTKAEGVLKEFGQDDDDLQESWTTTHVCRSSNSEIYDIAWSPDSKYVLTGSTDNITRIFDVKTGQLVNSLAEHTHYVQGVAWDPLNQFLATQSADRSVHVYRLKSSKEQSFNPCIFQKSSRGELATRKVPEGTTTTAVSVEESSQMVQAQRSTLLYHTEGLRSFFRRLTFSPDGSLLLAPSGISKTANMEDLDQKDELTNTVYIYTRKGLNKAPVAHIPGIKKPALVISFSQVFYELDPNAANAFKLPYKMIYAVATVDSVLIFDTQHEDALGSVSSIHYSTLTDISWNSDGQSLIVSSADGFCTSLKFAPGVFGPHLTVPFQSLLPAMVEPVKSGTPVSTRKRSPKESSGVTKKLKTDGTPTKPQRATIIDEPKKEKLTPIVLDLLKKKEPVEVPPVKQKKRVSPTLITTTSTVAASSETTSTATKEQE